MTFHDSTLTALEEDKPSTRIYLVTENTPVQLGMVSSFEISHSDNEEGEENRWHVTGLPNLPNVPGFHLVVLTMVRSFVFVSCLWQCERDSYHLHVDLETHQMEIAGTCKSHVSFTLSGVTFEDAIQHATGLGH